MPTREWICPNIGNDCPNADAKKIFTKPTSEEAPMCDHPGCESKLHPWGAAPTKRSWLFVTATIAVVILLWKFWPEETPRGKLSITSANLVVVPIGNVVDHLIRVNHKDARVEIADLPSWLRFDSGTKRVTGTPPAEGKAILAVSARVGGATATQALQISIAPLAPLARRRILVPIKAADTNLVIELVTDQVVSSVKVRVNSGVEQTLENPPIESRTIELNPAVTPERLFEVITQINNDPPKIHRFNYDERRIEVWVAGVHNCVLAAERISMGFASPAVREDKELQEMLQYWVERYPKELRVLPVFDDEPTRKKAQTRLDETFAKGRRASAFALMLPLMGQHIAQMKLTGNIPTNFVSEIEQTMKANLNKSPAKLVEEFRQDFQSRSNTLEKLESK